MDKLTDEEITDILKIAYKSSLLVNPQFLDIFLENMKKIKLEYQKGDELVLCNDFGSFYQGCWAYKNYIDKQTWEKKYGNNKRA